MVSNDFEKPLAFVAAIPECHIPNNIIYIKSMHRLTEYFDIVK